MLCIYKQEEERNKEEKDGEGEGGNKKINGCSNQRQDEAIKTIQAYRVIKPRP